MSNLRSAETEGHLVPGQHGVRRDVRVRGRQLDGEQDEAAVGGEAAPGETAGLPGLQHRPPGPAPQERHPGHQL